MKTLTVFLLLVLTATTLQAQSVLRYEFLNDLNEKNGLGPALTVLGNEGTFVLDTLNEISGNTKTVYRFEKNSGIQFDNAAAGNFIGSSYSIEIYFVFDELSSWKRVVDWKNRKTDYGAYVYYGELNFYPYIYSDDAPVIAGEYTYYVITRDAATNQVLIYTDADEEISFTDNNSDAVVDADNVLNFFHDDLAVPNEAAPGAVALINLYNYVLDSNTVKQNFENIGSQVFSVKELRKANVPVRVYPNPATDNVTVDITGFKGETVNVSIYNSSGIQVFKQTVSIGNSLAISTSAFPDGIYMIRAESETLRASQKLVVVQER
jgi:hypothetical protein